MTMVPTPGSIWDYTYVPPVVNTVCGIIVEPQHSPFPSRSRIPQVRVITRPHLPFTFRSSFGRAFTKRSVSKFLLGTSFARKIRPVSIGKATSNIPRWHSIMLQNCGWIRKPQTDDKYYPTYRTHSQTCNRHRVCLSVFSCARSLFPPLVSNDIIR